MMTPRRIVASYLFVQAAATAAWWVLLFAYPASIAWFQPSGWPDLALLGYGLSDLVLLFGGSIMAGVAVLRNVRWASTAIWALAAAAWYPTLTCIGVSWMTGEAWIAAGLMVCMAGLNLAMATIYGTAERSPATFRVLPLRRGPALGWTIAQVVIFWSVFLLVLPCAIVELERCLRWPEFSFQGQSFTAIMSFATASALGLASASVMAVVGRGTPLPTAAAPRLIVTGPYRLVRNPMAVAGITQGLAVGCYLGSYGVLAYASLGAVVWHLAVRPVEEQDLQRRFGARYRRYQQEVGLWIPHFSQCKLALRRVGSWRRVISLRSWRPVASTLPIDDSKAF
ncbi:MAG: methyltransferase family protein [Blastopirellula sp. JB062]